MMLTLFLELFRVNRSFLSSGLSVQRYLKLVSIGMTFENNGDLESTFPKIARFDEEFDMEEIYKTTAAADRQLKASKSSDIGEKPKLSPEQLRRKKELQQKVTSDKAYDAYWKKQTGMVPLHIFFFRLRCLSLSTSQLPMT